MSLQGIALFPTTSAVLQAEKALLGDGLEVKLVPTPRKFSRDCGIAVRFEWAQRLRIEEALREAGVEPSGIHAIGA
jgi:hypothetical protein